MKQSKFMKLKGAFTNRVTKFVLKYIWLKAKEESGRGWDSYIDHQLNGHELEQTPGDSGGQGSLACYSPRGRKDSGVT